METTQHLVVWWARLVWRLGRWRRLQALLSQFGARFTTWPADDFQRFLRTQSDLPARSLRAALPPELAPYRLPDPVATAPASVELRFTRLQREGCFEDMWPMLAEDAQRSWGTREKFFCEMREQSCALRVVDAQVERVEIVPEWTDSRRQRTYHNVARLGMRYRIQHDEEEISMTRDVHLIPAADGWRTLCYAPQR